MDHVGRRRQQGVSLIIALIILGAMMLTGVAMFRKLSAASLITGNLTFTNSAIAAADGGQEAGRAWLMGQTGNGLFKPAVHIPGYFPAHCYVNKANEAGDVKCTTAATPPVFDPRTFEWDDADNSVPSTDAAGNSIRYVVHRLCDVAGSVDDSGQNCVVAMKTGVGSGGHGTVTYGTQQLQSTKSPYYRITTRVQGPRNAVAYTQVTMF